MEDFTVIGYYLRQGSTPPRVMDKIGYFTSRSLFQGGNKGFALALMGQGSEHAPPTLSLSPYPLSQVNHPLDQIIPRATATSVAPSLVLKVTMAFFNPFGVIMVLTLTNSTLKYSLIALDISLLLALRFTMKVT